jgi:pSer/pThr/pTyr-binding forkhead associated (FHA) protein
MDVESHGANVAQTIPVGAFLVVDGVQIVPLTQAVMSIGRAPENDLVINDQRVSRQHAQLRAVDGRFVIFDLDSTGGTILNGQPVVQHFLTPGDVILLAGVPLVYGQEGQAGSDFTKELDI